MSDANLQLTLPFSLKDAVSVKRTSLILGVSNNVVFRILGFGVLTSMQRGERGPMHIRHASLVEYCDRLRETFGLPNRRPILSNPIFRHADRDIPPFPLEMNLSVAQVMAALQLEKSRVIQMANRQQLEAYQLTPVSPWRFYRPSVEKYIAAIHAKSKRTPSPLYNAWGM